MKKICAALLLLTSLHSMADPGRKAIIGAMGSFTDAGMTVDSVLPNSTISAAGLKKGDVITTINGQPVKEQQGYNTAVSNIRTGDELSVGYLRDGKAKSKKVKAIMRPYEVLDIADVYYGWVPYNQCSLRTITRKPKGKDIAPAVLLVPGYNCGSVENYMGGIYKNLITEWLKAGYIVVTIEKTGLGDSYNCQPCMQADLVTDIETFDAGYKYMESLPYADKNNLFIWGHSMGGIIAPEIAKKHNPKGVIVFGTVFRPWAEFLPEMHRIQFPLDGHSYAKTEQDVRLIHRIYDDFFNKKMTVEQLHQNPEYAALVEREFGYKKDNTDLWGRHYRFWQQIDSLDMAASWSAVQCPVLSVFGGADFIACSELEHKLLTDAVNASHPGNGTHIVIPDVDHLILKSKDQKDAYNAFNNRASWPERSHIGFTQVVNKWMNEQVSRQ